MPVKAVQCWDFGDKAGFVMLWLGTVKCGDNFEPEVYNYEVEFNLGTKVKEGRGAYLFMMTKGINYGYNRIYINGYKISSLTPQGAGWGIDTFCIPAGHVNEGKNTFLLTARNKTGGYTGEVDDIWVRDPILIYAVD